MTMLLPVVRPLPLPKGLAPANVPRGVVLLREKIRFRPEDAGKFVLTAWDDDAKEPHYVGPDGKCHSRGIPAVECFHQAFQLYDTQIEALFASIPVCEDPWVFVSIAKVEVREGKVSLVPTEFAGSDQA